MVILFVILNTCTSPQVKVKPEKTIFRFVFLGDSRGNYKANPPVYLAEEVLDQITKQIIALDPKPEFVIFNGDMVAKSTYKNAPEKIEKWKSLFLKPIKKNKIKVYITPGNHILDQKEKSGKEVKYIPLFRKYYMADNPTNGPRGYKGVSYSFTVKNTHFATVTSFVTHAGYDNTEIKPEDFLQKKKVFEYYVNQKNQSWLKNDLEKNNSDFKIFFTHSALYPIGPHYMDKKGLNAHPESRNNLLKILTNNNVDIFIASHEHLYARSNLSNSNPKDSKLTTSLPQVIVGSASAPLSNKPARQDIIFEKYVKDYDYLVADVKTSYILCTVYNNKKKIIDQFIITNRRIKTKSLN
jgi:predicted phosphodiesterase